MATGVEDIIKEYQQRPDRAEEQKVDLSGRGVVDAPIAVGVFVVVGGAPVGDVGG